MSEPVQEQQLSPFAVDGERYVCEVPDTLDLAERAAAAINALTRAVAPHRHYSAWQHMDFRARPARLAWPNFDIGVKYLESLPMMRVMCGSDQNLDVERAMMEAMLSLIGDDGLQYAPADDDWAGAYPLGNGRMMLAMSYWHQRDHDAAWLPRIAGIAAGLSKIALYRGDYAYYPLESSYRADGDWHFTTRDGQAYFDYHAPDEPARDQQGIEGGVRESVGNPLRGLVRWYETSGDAGALELAGKLVRYMLKPGFWEAGRVIDLVGPEHAEFIGHFHSTLVGLRGILEYAIATNDKRLKQFVRDGYTYARSFGISRIGWFPGSIAPEAWGRPRHEALRCEGCGVADMTALAVRLSQVGVGDFWEDVDQYVRNQLIEHQLVRSDLLSAASQASAERPLHPDSETDVDALARMTGAFTDWAGMTHAGVGAGCCTANCSQALYYAWDGIVGYSDEVAQVNLLLNRASPWVDVDSYLPYEGKVVLTNKAAQALYVRMPYWLDKAAVHGTVNGAAVPARWLGNYLVFTDLRPGDVAVVQFPIVEASETYRVGDTRYTCRFRGNTLVDIAPRDTNPATYPTYRRECSTGEQAPLKTVTRFVASRPIRW
ncbi:MAG: glycoside hydrolase family protein [Anaerolineae bacterium]